jgi:hypothetical protein
VSSGSGESEKGFPTGFGEIGRVQDHDLVFMIEFGFNDPFDIVPYPRFKVGMELDAEHIHTDFVAGDVGCGDVLVGICFIHFEGFGRLPRSWKSHKHDKHTILKIKQIFKVIG